MLKKILLLSCVSLNVLGMGQKLVLRCSKFQMTRISRGLNSEVFGSTIRSLLSNTVRSIVADDDRKNYTFTFDLDNKYIGDNPEKQRENLKEIFDFITAPGFLIKRVGPIRILDESKEIEKEEVDPCRYGS